LFGLLEAETGPLCEKARLLIAVLEMISLGRQVPGARGWRGRPAKDRQTLASAFVAKSVYGLPTTRLLLERLHSDRQLRCICGWTSARQIPHESTFSRAFQEFAATELPQRLREALILHTQQGRLVGHIARDSTAMEARERFQRPPKHNPLPSANEAARANANAHSLGVAYRASGDRACPTRYDHKRPPFTPAEEQRFEERAMVERVYRRLKDEFGARVIRVRGASKIMAHLMFGVLALTVDQLLTLTG
jgi:hypothetical protein